MTLYHHEKTENGAIVKDVSNRIVAFIEGRNISIVSNDEDGVRQYCEENKLVCSDELQQLEQAVK